MKTNGFIPQISCLVKTIKVFIHLTFTCCMLPAISTIHFPFELKKDQLEAAKAWINNGCRGSVIFSTGTGKTEIAFECAKLAAKLSGRDHFTILFLVPRIVL